MPISTAIDPAAVARSLGIETIFRDLRGGSVVYLPQRIAVMGQGNTSVTYSTDKRTITSASEAATYYGYGSMLHLAAKKLLPQNGDGVGIIPVTIFPLAEPTGTPAAATQTITPTGTATKNGTFRVYVNKVPSGTFSILKGEAPAVYAPKIATAINAEVDFPITAAEAAGVVTGTAKWKGATGNSIFVEVVGPTDIGVTWAYAHPANGTGLPTVDDALTKIGEVWETMGLNTNPYTDTTALDKLQTWGEGRWTAQNKKPMVWFTGCTEATLATVTAATDARKDDRVNALLNCPGSKELPWVQAARQLARIAKLAGSNPPHDYGRQKADGIEPGTDAEQWDEIQRETAVKAGASTIQVIDGVVNCSDIITMWHPTGETPPAYRYVVDIVKIANFIFNLDLIFGRPDWDGAPLVPDFQVVTNPKAKKPKMAKGEIIDLITAAAEEAIISDPDTAIANVQCQISETNPKRLDIAIQIQVSGNTNVKSITLYWGFYFGSGASE